MTECRSRGVDGDLRFYRMLGRLSEYKRDELTIEAVDDLHPLALALLHSWLFKGVLSFHELGPPLLNTVLLAQTVKILIYVCSSNLDIGLVIAR